MDSSRQKIFTETFKVHTYEVDRHNRLTIDSLCQYLQETASGHADSLGFGVEYLLENNRTWVLSRLGVDIKSPVYLGEDITIRTWPSGTRKFFFTRDFIIENGNGDTVGRALSYWIYLDTERMRPIPPSRNEILFDYNGLPEGFGRDLDKIDRPESPEYVTDFKVRYSDLDLNNHVNNITYIRWAMEGIDPEYKSDRRIESVDINFLSEVKYGDTVSLSMAPAGGERFVHIIKNETDDVCRMETRWTSV